MGCGKFFVKSHKYAALGTVKGIHVNRIPQNENFFPVIGSFIQTDQLSVLPGHLFPQTGKGNTVGSAVKGIIGNFIVKAYGRHERIDIVHLFYPQVGVVILHSVKFSHGEKIFCLGFQRDCLIKLSDFADKVCPCLGVFAEPGLIVGPGLAFQ